LFAASDEVHTDEQKTEKTCEETSGVSSSVSDDEEVPF
jgi:hypothetical protein